MTSTISTPPSAAQRFPSSLAERNLHRQQQFDAYLIISAVLQFVRSLGTEANGA